MVDTSKTGAELVSDLSESDEKALIAFKKLLNEKLATILPELEGWKNAAGKLVDEDADLFDGGFTNLINRFVLNEEKLKATPALKEIVDKFNELPEAVKEPITLNRTFFARTAEGISAKEQAQAVINLAQNYLDKPETSDGNVDQTTADALKEKLKLLQQQNPDIEIEFSPQHNDRNTVKFLEALVQKRMEEAKVSGGDTNNLMIHLWALEQDGKTEAGSPRALLGEAVSFTNLMKLVVQGSLPSGDTTSRPVTDAPWDKGWTNESAPDRFFSDQTYQSLVDTRAEDGVGFVYGATLFAETPSNPNAKILRELAEKAGMDITQEKFSLTEVGQLAADMLTYKAKELGLEEGEINQAIHSARFMPHLEDLLIVEKGFNNGSKGQALWEHQSNAFAARFGRVDEAFFKTLEDDRLHGRNFKPEIHQSPASYFKKFGVITGNTKPIDYEIERERQYLPKLAEFSVDGKTSPFTGRPETPEGGKEGLKGAPTVESVYDREDAAPGKAPNVEDVIDRQLREKDGEIKPEAEAKGKEKEPDATPGRTDPTDPSVKDKGDCACAFAAVAPKVEDVIAATKAEVTGQEAAVVEEVYGLELVGAGGPTVTTKP